MNGRERVNTLSGAKRSVALRTDFRIQNPRLMKAKQLLLSSALLFAAGSLPAQFILSDFSDFGGQSPTYFDTWLDNGTPQIISLSDGDGDYISVEPQALGNPRGEGRFEINFGVALDLGDYTDVSVTARLHPTLANELGEFGVVFYDGLDRERRYGFSSGSLNNSTFAQLSLDLSNSANYSEPLGAINTANIVRWGIEGDYSPAGDTDNVRLQFDQVALTPVPEPATWALLLLGAGWMGRKRLAALFR